MRTAVLDDLTAECPLWILSCYCHKREGDLNDLSGDVSFEELRWRQHQVRSGVQAQQPMQQSACRGQYYMLLVQWRFTEMFRVMIPLTCVVCTSTINALVLPLTQHNNQWINQPTTTIAQSDSPLTQQTAYRHCPHHTPPCLPSPANTPISHLHHLHGFSTLSPFIGPNARITKHTDRRDCPQSIPPLFLLQDKAAGKLDFALNSDLQSALASKKKEMESLKRVSVSCFGQHSRGALSGKGTVFDVCTCVAVRVGMGSGGKGSRDGKLEAGECILLQPAQRAALSGVVAFFKVCACVVVRVSTSLGGKGNRQACHRIESLKQVSAPCFSQHSRGPQQGATTGEMPVSCQGCDVRMSGGESGQGLMGQGSRQASNRMEREQLPRACTNVCLFLSPRRSASPP